MPTRRTATAACSPAATAGTTSASTLISELAVALAAAATVGAVLRCCGHTMLPRSTETAKMLEHGAEELLPADLPDFAGEDAQP